MELSKQYILGIEETDQEHRLVVEILTQIWDSYPRENHAEQVTLLQQLKEHVSSHFSKEEALMAIPQYTLFANHFAAHRAFFNEISSYL